MIFSIVSCSLALTVLAASATASRDVHQPTRDLGRLQGGRLGVQRGRRRLEVGQRHGDRGVDVLAAVLLHVVAGLLGLRLGRDLTDQLGALAPVPRLGDGSGAGARLLHHGDRTVLAGGEDRHRHEQRGVGQGVPLLVGERGLVGHEVSWRRGRSVARA